MNQGLGQQLWGAFVQELPETFRSFAGGWRLTDRTGRIWQGVAQHSGAAVVQRENLPGSFSMVLCRNLYHRNKPVISLGRNGRVVRGEYRWFLVGDPTPEKITKLAREMASAWVAAQPCIRAYNRSPGNGKLCRSCQNQLLCLVN